MLYVKTLGTDSSAARHNGGIELLKFAMIREYGLEIEESMILRGEHGKPYIEKDGVHFSISHSKDRVAVLTAERPCGVDIEKIRPANPAVIKRVCTQKESDFIAENAGRFTLIWTLKESYVKATGQGFAFGFKNIEFTISDGKITSNINGRFETKESDGFIISCCIL